MALAIGTFEGIGLRPVVFTGGDISFSGDGGASLPQVISVIAANIHDWAPLEAGSIRINPGGAVHSGADSSGGISASDTWTGCGPSGSGPPDGQHYNSFASPGTPMFFPNGFLGQSITVTIAVDDSPGGPKTLYRASFSISSLSPDDVPTDNTYKKPTDPTGDYDGRKIKVKFTDSTDPHQATTVQRSDDGGMTWHFAGQLLPGETEFDDPNIESGKTYKYRLFVFDATPRKSLFSDVVTVVAVLPSSLMPLITFDAPLHAQGPLPSVVDLSSVIVPGSNYVISTYTWQLYSGPASGSAEVGGNKQQGQITFDAYAPGSYVVSLTLNGTFKDSGTPAPPVTSRVTVIVPDKQAPVIQSGKTSVGG